MSVVVPKLGRVDGSSRLTSSQRQLQQRRVHNNKRISRAPKWIAAIKGSSGLHLTVSCSIVIFGIGVPPIYQGALGIIFSIEGYHGVVSYNTTRVKLFILGLLFSSCISSALGALAVLGLPVGVANPVEDCRNENSGIATRANDTFFFIDPNDPCQASYQMYGFVQLASGLLSFFLCVIVTLSYQGMRRDCQALQLAKEYEYERFFYG